MFLSDIPEVAALWHPTKNGDLTPETVSSGSKKKTWWVCPVSGGTYQRAVYIQVRVGTRSPFTAGKKVLFGYNDLATTHPDIAALWHPTKNGELTPRDVSHGSHKKVWWLCPYTGEGYESQISNKVINGHLSSPYESSQKILQGHNDLATTHPDVAALWHPTKNGELTPEAVSYGHAGKVWWVCPDTGKEYYRSVAKQTAAGLHSPFATGRKISAGHNDLATTHPEIAALWHPTKNGDLTPQCVSCGSSKKVWWICPSSKGEYHRRIKKQVFSGTSSPYSTGRRLLSGYNDLATAHPEIAALWHPVKNGELTPEMVIATSKNKVWWHCPVSKGDYYTSIEYQIKTGPRSPYLTGQKTLYGFNDLTTKKPDIAAHWHPTKNGDLTPEMVTCGSSKKVWWVCPETGRDFQRVVAEATTHGVLCPTVSSGEIAVFDFIESLNVNPIRSDRTVISPYELDIVIPDKKIAVEYNGLYWHSELKISDKNYHYNKWLAAQEAGYQLITIWEDDWRNKPEVVKSMLQRKLGVDKSPTIGARKCSVMVLTKQECASILDQHHIQGYASGSIYLGLRNREGALVAASSWTKTGADLRLDRFATSCRVPGGMGKLLKAAQRWCDNNGCTRIITFSDHEVSDGALYDKLGFTREAELAPDYKYVQDNVRKHKFGFRLKKFQDNPELRYQEGLTERELAELNGISRIWDCGKTRHVLTWDRESSLVNDDFSLFPSGTQCHRVLAT